MAINLGRWFRDRKKQAEGVVAQANPFDGGKTYNTVINNTPVAKPVQTQVNTAQPGWSVRTQPTQPSWLQKQNDFNTSLSAITAPKPQVAQTPKAQEPNLLQQRIDKSYGDGFTGLKNKVRDVFDANTEADYIKRRAQSGLTETYAQQQERLTKQAISSSGKRNAANQFAGAGLKNIADRAGKLPGSIMQVQGRVAKSVNDIDNPVLRYGAKALTTPFGGLMTDEQANRSLRYGQQINKSIDNKLQQSSLGDRKDDNKWARMGGQMVTDLPLQIATGGAGLAALGTQMTADEANKAEAAGRTNTQSLGVGVLQGGASALSEKFGIDKFLPGNGVAGNSVIKVLKRFGTEGGQEAQQQFTQNLIANKTYDPNQGLKDGVFESAILGGIAGGAMSPIADLANIGTTPNTPTQLTPEVQNKRNNLANAYTTLVDQGRPDQAAYFAREIDQIDNPAPGTLRERIRSAKERIITPLDGVGSVPIGSPLIPIPKKLQNKLSGADPLESLKQEARKYKSAEEFVKAQRSNTNFDPVEAREVFRNVKPGDGEPGVTKALTDFYNQAHAEAKAQTPNESTKRPIKPAPAKPLSVVDRVNSINETPKAPTKDKVLASLEKQKRDLIDYEARARYETGKEIAQKQKELRKTIKDQWTGQTDIEDLPRSIKGGKLQGSWAGKSFDELAHDLGFESDSALADELFTHTTQEKLSDLREVVEDTIKRGDSPLSDNYKKLLQEIDDRQAELLRYPEGARALENKPSPKMSKAERESLHASAPVGTERKLKVATPVANKKVPVRKLTQEGDVVTATNVNPDIKATEKRYSIDDSGQMIEDRKGAYRIFNDGEGKITGVRIGKKYYSAKELGDLSDVNDYGSSLATMRRNIERAFGKETGDKLSRFVVDHQQKQATKLIDRQVKLKQGTDALAKELGISFGMGSKRAKQVSASIQDYGEKKITKQDLVKQYGNDMANKIVKADSWFKSQYDQLLDEMNTTLTTYGYDPVPRHKNYYTHFQDQSLWSKVGLKMQEIRSLSSPTMQDSMPAPTRGKIDNTLAGQSEFLLPNKRFNPFALQRKGDTHTSDAFQSFERYLTPTLNNIYMTPSITRARVVSQAVAEQANLAGKDANGVMIQMREWANRLAGKTSRIDRTLVDSKWGNTALRASQWAQRKAGANTIVGNLSTAVMQPVVLTQTTGKFGLRNTLLATVQEMSTAHSKDAPIRQSEFMRRRYADIANTTRGKIDRAADIANTPLKVVEETAARITWNAAHNDALSKGIRGDAAIKYADVQAEKTLSGRSIGERPELFDAKAPGIFTMYQLEVNNYWQQVGKEMTKAQAARTMAAAYGFNLLMGAINGRSVGFNPIDAILDSIGMLDDEDEDNVAKAKRIAQRLGGELVDSLPFAGAVGTTVMGEQGWKDLMGKDSTSGRFGFSNAPRTLYENPGMLITPFGYNQARKTIQGLDTWRKGQLESKSGKKLTDVPQTKTNLAKALAFGKSAIPEVSEYYNNIGQKKTNKNATGVAGIRAEKGYYKTNDAEYNAFKDEYNQKIKDGSYSKAQRIKADYTLSKLKVGSNFSKDSRDLYNVSEKALSSWLATEEKGVDKQKLANELIAYDQALYNAGLISRLKYKGGIAAKSSGRGGKRGGGRGRKSSFSMADFTTNPQLQTQTYQNLNKLLAGTTFKGGKKPSKTGKSGKVAQKQIKVNMKA